MKTNVPKILHWVWLNFKDPTVRGEPPENRIPFQESWIKHHPDYEVKVWRDAEARELLETHYSWFLPTYDSYPSAIFRADAIRYFILFHYGGLYIDWDYQCFKNTDELWAYNNKQFWAFYEPPEHAERWINNGLMAATKNSSVMKVAISYLKPAPGNMFMDVINTTGPGFLSPHANRHPDAMIRDHRYTMPWNAASKELQTSEELRQHVFETTGCYALHTWDGCWGHAIDGMGNTRRRHRFNRRRLSLN